jgi:hypothetical protein
MKTQKEKTAILRDIETNAHILEPLTDNCDWSVL